MAPGEAVGGAERHGVLELAHLLAVVAMSEEGIDGVDVGAGVGAYGDALSERRDAAQSEVP